MRSARFGRANTHRPPDASGGCARSFGRAATIRSDGRGPDATHDTVKHTLRSASTLIFSRAETKNGRAGMLYAAAAPARRYRIVGTRIRLPVALEESVAAGQARHESGDDCGGREDANNAYRANHDTLHPSDGYRAATGAASPTEAQSSRVHLGGSARTLVRAEPVAGEHGTRGTPARAAGGEHGGLRRDVARRGSSPSSPRSGTRSARAGHHAHDLDLRGARALGGVCGAAVAEAHVGRCAAGGRYSVFR